MNRAEKLATAAWSAPRLRAKAVKPSRRKIVVVDKDGNPVREMTDVELAAKLHERAGIEFDVQDDVAPTHKPCDACGKPFDRRGFKNVKLCTSCRTGNGQTVCAGWDGNPCENGSIPPNSAWCLVQILRRNGSPWRCFHCAMKIRVSRWRKNK